MTASTIYKIVLMLKRRPGMSFEAFRDYYERHHAPLAGRHGAAALTRYIRRYLVPQDHPENGPAGELPFDVLTEMWFEDEQTFDATLAFITTTASPAEIVADEMELFDRSAMRIATVIERETNLNAVPAAQRD